MPYKSAFSGQYPEALAIVYWKLSAPQPLSKFRAMIRRMISLVPS